VNVSRGLSTFFNHFSRYNMTFSQIIRNIGASILLLVCVSELGCTDNEGSMRALQGNGFTDIRLTGYEWLGCGRDDSYSTGFYAKNPNGVYVSGVVCCGTFKSCTVRF
jgi:hypothetical protein